MQLLTEERKVGKAALLAKQDLKQFRMDLNRTLRELQNVILACDDLIRTATVSDQDLKPFKAQKDEYWRLSQGLKKEITEDADKSDLQDIEEEIARLNEKVTQLQQSLTGIESKLDDQKIQTRFDAIESTMEKIKDLFDFAYKSNYDDQALQNLQAKWAMQVLNLAQPLFQNNHQKSLTTKDEAQVKQLADAVEDFIDNRLKPEAKLFNHYQDGTMYTSQQVNHVVK